MIVTMRDLKIAAQELGRLLERIAAAAQAETDTLAKIQNDTSRSPSWKLEQEAQLRKDSKVDDMFAEMRTRWNEMQAYRTLWCTPMLVLGRQPVNPSDTPLTGAADARTAFAANEATIRMNFRQELAAMSKGLAFLVATEAKLNRQWWKIYEAALVLDKMPFDLESLPLPDLEQADEIFFLAEGAFRQAEIDAQGLRGGRGTEKKIALTLLTERHERIKAQRSASWDLNLDEIQALGLDKPAGGNILAQLTPKPFSLTIPATGGPDVAGGVGED